jgi:zinc protease
MRRVWTWLGCGLASLLAVSSAQALELPYKKTKLSNGMTVIVHEDHQVPLVAVNIMVHVGSQDEEAGRTGFAHLFEHLMFMGTKRVPEKMFDAWMESVGGSNNAWTSEDFTDYHEVGPPGALPLLLWLEADRFEALGSQINLSKLNTQRGVVRNERRQTSENTPYGKVGLRLPELLYPTNHPYHHPVIGSHKDLEAATVTDVQGFFQKYYVASNASLVVAGDVKSEEVVAQAEKYFGILPATPAPARAKPSAPAKLGKIVRETIQDRVEHSKLVIAFHSPAHFQPGDAELDLLASILASGKSSRLYKSLVYRQSIAQNVEAYQASNQLSSMFVIEVLAKPGKSLEQIEKAVDKELTDLLTRKPPTDKELKRAQASYEFRFVNGLQALTRKASLLNTYEAEKSDPGFLKSDLSRYQTAKVADLSQWAKKTFTLKERAIVRVIPQFNAAP